MTDIDLLAYYGETTLLRIGLGIFNIVLLTIIMYVAYMDYRKVKARFTLGLMIFGLALMFHTLISNPIFHLDTCIQFSQDILFVLLLVADAFEAFALTVFLFLIRI
jgi:hypothetical protein